jgi:heme O synthase-like polyprenyltransferase
MRLLSPLYFLAAVPLGALFLIVAVRTAVRREKRDGRFLLKASVLYLPCIFLLMTLTLV